MSQPTHLFQPIDKAAFDKASCVCIGTGRFLRAVLLPAMREMGASVVIGQTRGSTFGDYLHARGDGSYEVDVTLPSGKNATELFSVAAAGTLGTPAGRAAFMALPAQLPHLRLIGCGLTEAGICENGPAMVDVAEFLYQCWKAGAGRAHKLSIINTDNMPQNGDKIKQFVRSCAFTAGAADSEAFLGFLDSSVCFHNTMVDRIVAHRDGDTMVPKTEPLPKKAIVAEDLDLALPAALGACKGIIVRTQQGQLGLDLALKLRIANGTHSAMVYLMAVSRLANTAACIGHPHILPYLQHLFDQDIVKMVTTYPEVTRQEVVSAFDEWIGRITHPAFGLSCFWVSQNANSKLGIRFVPSILSALQAGGAPSEWMAFACAAMLRFLTPKAGTAEAAGGVFTGRLDDASDGVAVEGAEEYTPGMGYDLAAGTYQFKDGDGSLPRLLLPLAEAGDALSQQQTRAAVASILGRYEDLTAASAGAHAAAMSAFGEQVAAVLRRMLLGEAAMGILSRMAPAPAKAKL